MRIYFALTFVAAAGSVACGRPYHMEAQAAPSPFVRPGCRAVLEPIHTEQMLVGSMPESAYLARKQDKSAESYMVDKQESAGLFQQTIVDRYGTLFVAGAPDNTFIIRPTWTHWEPGSVVAFGSSRPSTADFMVDVLTPQGQLLDRFDFETAVSASIYNPSSGGRMRSALKKAGKIVADYINDNWVCAPH
jgi:hypothetical protein